MAARRRWVWLAAALGTTILVSVVALVFVLTSRTDETPEWLQNPPIDPGPGDWRRIRASTPERIVVEARRPGKGGVTTLAAFDAHRRQLWRLQDRLPGSFVSHDWLRASDETLIDLRSGSTTQLELGRGTLIDQREFLVHASARDGLRAFDRNNPQQMVWSVPEWFDGRTEAFVFGTRTGFFIRRRVALVEPDGAHEIFGMPGPPVAATHDSIFVHVDGMLMRYAVTTREKTGTLADVAPGLTSLGGFGELTLWHESGIEPGRQYVDASKPSRIFAWDPADRAVRWESETPAGYVFQSDSLLLRDALQPLPEHACWPIRGEQSSPLIYYGFVRIVCLHLTDGTITFRGGAGTRDVRAQHDAEGTTIMVRQQPWAMFVRLVERPVRVVRFDEALGAMAGSHVWVVRGRETLRLPANIDVDQYEGVPLEEVFAEPEPSQ